MFWLWLIVAILLIAGGMYVLGVLDWDEDNKLGLFWTIFIGSVLWPLVLGIVVVAGPFAGLFWLGDRARKAKQAAKDK
jgi:hypothetical protein